MSNIKSFLLFLESVLGENYVWSTTFWTTIWRGWRYGIIDNILSEYSDETGFYTVLIYITLTWCIHKLPLLNTFFLLLQTFLLINFIIIQLSTYQLRNYSSTSSLLISLISLSCEPRTFWQLPSCFRVSSYFLLFYRCCESWLPCMGLSLQKERYWQCLLHKIHKQIELKKGEYKNCLNVGNG